MVNEESIASFPGVRVMVKSTKTSGMTTPSPSYFHLFVHACLVGVDDDGDRTEEKIGLSFCCGGESLGCSGVEFTVAAR